MALTRAQLLMGNGEQGVVLQNQVQAVRPGAGIQISATGQISVDSQTAVGLMRLGPSLSLAQSAYNSYTWPTAAGAVGQQLGITEFVGTSAVLNWVDADNIPWTTKGQLVVGTGNNTQTLLNAGADGQILIANSATTSGLAYTANYVSTDGPTSGANIPYGNTNDRPSSPDPGSLRFNSQTNLLEFWDITTWSQVASSPTNSFVEKTSDTGAALLPVGTDGERPTASTVTGGLRYNTGLGVLEFSNGAAWLPVGAGSGSLAVDITVTPPVPGIDAATNVQRALELIELQAQDRIEFVNSSTPGLQIAVSAPVTTSNDGTTLTLGLDGATTSQPGIVQLTNDVTGSSQVLAITQQAASVMNAQIQALTGGNVLAGTYNSNLGQVATVTNAGGAAGFTVGSQAPAAATALDNYYLLVTTAGNQGPPGATIPGTGVQSGDWFIVQDDGAGASWVTIDFENIVVAASQVSLAPISGISATNVQTGLQELTNRTNLTFTAVSSTNNGITVANTTTAPFGKASAITLNPATATDIGGVFIAPNLGLNLSPAGGLSLAPPQGNTVLGGVKTFVGSGVTIAADGTISASGSGTGTVTSITASAPLTGGTITTNGTIGLSPSGVVAGSYSSANIVVDQYGRVTTASNGSGGGGGGGTVTSVNITGTGGITATGGPITSIGVFTVGLSISSLPLLP